MKLIAIALALLTTGCMAKVPTRSFDPTVCYHESALAASVANAHDIGVEWEKVRHVMLQGSDAKLNAYSLGMARRIYDGKVPSDTAGDVIYEDCLAQTD